MNRCNAPVRRGGWGIAHNCDISHVIFLFGSQTPVVSAVGVFVCDRFGKYGKIGARGMHKGGRDNDT